MYENNNMARPVGISPIVSLCGSAYVRVRVYCIARTLKQACTPAL